MRLREAHGPTAYSDAQQPADGPVVETRLRCALGHTYSGSIQKTWNARADMDWTRA